MLSNRKLEDLQKEYKYLLTSLQVRGSLLTKEGMKFINRELSASKAKVKEAKARDYVGMTETGKKVFLADSEWQDVCSKCIYIEDTPSGWDADNLDMTSGRSQTFVCDGGQGWIEVVTFN